MATEPIISGTIETIVAQQINTTAFAELAQSILDTLVNGDTSPFKDAQVLMEDYLTNAVDLDATQKAGLYAEFLKSSFQQINQQTINGAIDILKTNAQLEYEKYKVEGEYNLAIETKLKIANESQLLGKQAAKLDNDILLSEEQVYATRAQVLEGLAKLAKQYGYDTATVGDVGTSIAAALNAGTAANNGAIDKQIVGYDKVNYKDALKAINEMTALLVNAGTVPGTWMVDIQKLLIELISHNTTADSGINITGSGEGIVTDSTSTTSVAYAATGMNGFLGL